MGIAGCGPWRFSSLFDLFDVSDVMPDGTSRELKLLKGAS